jgi:hypothetical protein
MTDNKIIHKCSKCSKTYKGVASLQKHQDKCQVESSAVPPPVTNATNVTNKINIKPMVNAPKQPAVVQKINPPHPSHMVKENNYDINMTFGKDNKVQVEVKKQPTMKYDVTSDSGSETDSDDETGEKVLKDILRPKVSPTYQDEIDKLENLIGMFKTLPISSDPARKDYTIEQLKATVTILMTQSQCLIKEMKQMSRRNSYYKNNIMLAAFILDRCRMEVPETDEEFENMFSEK